jgi:hypothetical protein
MDTDSQVYIIDSETLDRYDSAIILSLAVIRIDLDLDPFELYDDWGTKSEDFCDPSNCLHVKIDRRAQVAMGRTCGQETVEWWSSQSESAKDVLSDNGCVQPIDAWNMVLRFLSKTKFKTADDVVSRGMFEAKLVEHFVQSLKRAGHDTSSPFQYFQWVDSRTICKIGTPHGDGNAGVKVEKFPKFVQHNALHDCFLDWLRLWKLTEGKWFL